MIFWARKQELILWKQTSFQLVDIALAVSKLGCHSNIWEHMKGTIEYVNNMLYWLKKTE